MQATRSQAVGETSQRHTVFPGIVKAGSWLCANMAVAVPCQERQNSGLLQYRRRSYGLQAVFNHSVMQCFHGQCLVELLNRSEGWGSRRRPSIVVVVDAGMAKSSLLDQRKKVVYALFLVKRFDAGLGLQGSKISRINPD